MVKGFYFFCTQWQLFMQTFSPNLAFLYPQLSKCKIKQHPPITQTYCPEYVLNTYCTCVFKLAVLNLSLNCWLSSIVAAWTAAKMTMATNMSVDGCKWNHSSYCVIDAIFLSCNKATTLHVGQCFFEFLRRNCLIIKTAWKSKK